MTQDLFSPEKYVSRLNKDMARYTNLHPSIFLNKKKEFKEFKSNLDKKFNINPIDDKIFESSSLIDKEEYIKDLKKKDLVKRSKEYRSKNL